MHKINSQNIANSWWKEFWIWAKKNDSFFKRYFEILEMRGDGLKRDITWENTKKNNFPDNRPLQFGTLKSFLRMVGRLRVINTCRPRTVTSSVWVSRSLRRFELYPAPSSPGTDATWGPHAARLLRNYYDHLFANPSPWRASEVKSSSTPVWWAPPVPLFDLCRSFGEQGR